MTTLTSFVRPPARWIAPPVVDPAVVAHLAETLSLPAVLCQLLVQRGHGDVEAAKRFLRPRLEHLRDAYELKGMTHAVDRLVRAIRAGEKIMVHGDYDVDGMCSTALLTRAFRQLGGNIEPFIPHRIHDGYDLTDAGVRAAIACRARVVLTADCGTSALPAVAALCSAGIDVIVSDHHLPGGPLPECVAVLNPKQPGCESTDKDSAAVGIAFKLALAVTRAMRPGNSGDGFVFSLLDLVALGTVADVVPLDAVNRRLVEAGLRRMRDGQANAGINALFDVAKRDVKKATAYDLGFMLGPRVNAAGRLDDISLGIECLTTDDPARAAEIADELDRLNRERKGIESGMREEADQLITGTFTPEQKSIVVTDPTWHQGVVGIVAGRLREAHHRPTIVFAPGDVGELKGSGRSIPGFHLRDALDLVSKRGPQLMRKFGGHAMAAGLTIAEENFTAFAQNFEQVASELLTPDQLEQRVESDGSFALDEFDFDTAHALYQHVWGQAFPAPLFDDEFTVMDSRIVGLKHTKMRLKREGRTFDAIRFGCTEPPPQPLRAAYRVSLSEYQGVQRLELIIERWWPVS